LLDTRPQGSSVAAEERQAISYRRTNRLFIILTLQRALQYGYGDGAGPSGAGGAGGFDWNVMKQVKPSLLMLRSRTKGLEIQQTHARRYII
jgi:hypothetical protein